MPNPALLLILAALLILPGCSTKRFIADRIGNSIAGGASVYASDDDPELVGAALPFGLKTIEGLLAESPHNRGLLLAATSGFTQYGYAFVQTEADFIEDSDPLRAISLRERAGKLYRRAMAYGVRGLEEIQPGVVDRLRKETPGALTPFTKKDVPALYWTAAAWGAAISINKTDSSLSADLPLVEALIRRAIELDEGYDLGVLHDFLIAYEGGRPAAGGGSIERARASLDRAVALSRGRRAAPLVSYAETVDVSMQNREEFKQLLDRALAIDINADPEQRLSNVLAQRRAKWLLGRMDRLFID